MLLKNLFALSSRVPAGAGSLGVGVASEIHFSYLSRIFFSSSVPIN